MRRIISLVWMVIGALAGGGTTAFAQISVEAHLEPRLLTVGETAQLQVVVRGARRPEPPRIPSRIGGLRISYQGMQQRISIINAERDEAQVFLYAVFAEQAGDFQVGPLKYPVNGQTIEIPAIGVRVVPAGSDPNGRIRSLSEVLFAELRAGRSHPFVGEEFDLELVVGYRRINLAPDMSLDKLPETGLQFGRWAELPGGREARNGMLFDVRRFRCRVRPLAAGTYRLTPTLKVQVLVERRDRRDPFFERFFPDWSPLADLPGFSRVEKQPLDLTVQPLDITVRPLPAENRPSAFNGAVGRFDFDVTVSPTSVAAGEPVTVRIVIEGEGNLAELTAPAWHPGDAFRVYDVRQTESVTDRAGRHVRRVFEQVVIPRDEQGAELAPIEFAYFDPAVEAYRVIRRGPFPLEVRPARGSATVVASGETEKPMLQIRGQDIVYLKPTPARWRRRDEPCWYERPWARVWPWLAALLPACTALYAQRRARQMEDPARQRRARAPRAARAALRRASQAARQGRRTALYDAVWEALMQYFGGRLGLPPGEISISGILARLVEHDAEWERVLRAVFEQCEAARFTGAAQGPIKEEDRALLDQVAAVLHKAEKQRWAS